MNAKQRPQQKRMDIMVVSGSVCINEILMKSHQTKKTLRKQAAIGSFMLILVWSLASVQMSILQVISPYFRDADTPKSAVWFLQLTGRSGPYDIYFPTSAIGESCNDATAVSCHLFGLRDDRHEAHVPQASIDDVDVLGDPKLLASLSGPWEVHDWEQQIHIAKESNISKHETIHPFRISTQIGPFLMMIAIKTATTQIVSTKKLLNFAKWLKALHSHCYVPGDLRTHKLWMSPSLILFWIFDSKKPAFCVDFLSTFSVAWWM